MAIQDLIDTATAKATAMAGETGTQPNVFDRETAQGFGQQAAGLAGQGVNPQLQEMLMQLFQGGGGNFGNLGQFERDAIGAVQGRAQGLHNRRGIGASPVAQNAIAASGLEPLMNFRQQKIDNLFKNLGLDLQGQGRSLQTYLQLAGLGTPVTTGFRPAEQPEPGLFDNIGINFGF